MADYTDMELLQSQDRLWEMGTPGGATIGGKPKKRCDYTRRTRTLADYRGGPQLDEETPQITEGQRPMFGTLPTPAEQYEMSQGALNAAMNNIRRENDSRVSQRREMRRLGADYEMERLRQQGANYRANVDAEAQLIRQLLADM